MAFVKISEDSLVKFKDFLHKNDVNSNTVRIHLVGMGCGGPLFNLLVDEKKDDDNVETIGDFTFLVAKKVTELFGTITLEPIEDKGIEGFSVDTEIKPSSGGCSGCNSCN